MIEGVWQHKESGRYFEVAGVAIGPYGKKSLVIYKPVGHHKTLSYMEPEQFTKECISLDQKLSNESAKRIIPPDAIADKRSVESW